MKRLAALVLLAASTASAAPGAASGDEQSLLAAVDATRNAFDEAVITARATQIVDGRETSSADFDVYVKGRDKGLIVFRGGKNSGRKVQTNGNRMWLLVPGSTNPVPITANQRLLGGASFGRRPRTTGRPQDSMHASASRSSAGVIPCA